MGIDCLLNIYCASIKNELIQQVQVCGKSPRIIEGDRANNLALLPNSILWIGIGCDHVSILDTDPDFE